MGRKFVWRGKRNERTRDCDRPRREGVSARPDFDSGLERHQPESPGGRVRRVDGAVRLGQDDALEPHRGHRHADARADRHRWQGHRDDVADGARRVALEQRGLHLPALQPATRAERLRKRRAAAAADEALPQGAAPARRDGPQDREPLGPHGPLSAAALGRPGAAGRDRPGHRVRPERSSSPTSPPATSTRNRPTRSSSCCARSTRSSARRS